MKVFELNTFCGIKSTGRIATDIALLLEKQGHACRVGYGAESVPAALARFAYRIGNPIERKIHGAMRKFFDAEGYGSRIGTLFLIRELKRFQPDVVHLHNLHGCYVNLRLLFRYLKKSGIPVAWTLHDCWSMTGHCAYFEYAKCEKWKEKCGECPQLKSYPICLGLGGSRRNLRRKKAVLSGMSKMMLVTPSQWLSEYVTESFLKAYPVRVIYNGVDSSVFQPAQKTGDLRARYGITAKYVVLAVAAEWDERKGLRYLLKASERLSEEYQVVILGLQKAQILELPARVIGIESTHNVQELAAWYSLASCLANPTMEDNMPMVNLEALACGTPVAVFHTGGCPEVIDETCGRVLPQGDASALAKAIVELSSQKEEMCEACVARSNHFTSEACYQQYIELYEELMQ